MLTLECNADMVDFTPEIPCGEGHSIIMTPPIDEDYWMFRVKLGRSQAIVGFPKFFTIGIGFAKETDWNTNLPYTSDAESIFEHIRHNKGRIKASDADCIEAIRMVQQAAKELKAKESK